MNKRQEVGRGMRLCVNQQGDRIDGNIYGVKVHDINVLTVIASDSYKKFVERLQKELKDTLYDRPTKATKEYFEGKIVKIAGITHEITYHEAAIIERYLGFNGYIDYDGNVTDKYREAHDKNTFAELLGELAPLAEGIHKLVQGVFDEKVLEEIITPANKSKITQNDLNENFAKKEFQTLWKQINHKYAYTVSFDSELLISRAIAAIDEKLFVSKLTYVRTTGSQGQNILDFSEGKIKYETLRICAYSNASYDLIGKICQGTTLTRKTVATILKGIRAEVFDFFKNNPEEFIARAIRLINEQKAGIIVDAITYNITDEKPYDNDIFTLGGAVTLDRVVKAQKHIAPYIVVDSETERNFAKALENDEDKVCVYAKLPRDFKIPTPVGNYSPDWAITFNEGTVKYIYFIAETKGSEKHIDELEKSKIACARKLFEKLGSGVVHYDVADTYQHLMDIMSK